MDTSADNFRTMIKPPAGLLVVSGPARGTRIAVPLGGLVLGRSGTPEGRLGEDTALSRQHAVIVHSDRGELVVSDLGSTNGTFLNGSRVEDSRLVRPGDIIELGNTKLQALGHSPGSSPAAAGTTPGGAQSRMTPAQAAPHPAVPAAAPAPAAPHPAVPAAAPAPAAPHPAAPAAAAPAQMRPGAPAAAVPAPVAAHPAAPAAAVPAQARPGAGPLGGAADRPPGPGAPQGRPAGSPPAPGPRTPPADGAHAELAGIVQAELASLARRQWHRLVSKLRTVTGYVAVALLAGLVVTVVMMTAM